jgi:exodeoxyribonuclease VII large subunit
MVIELLEPKGLGALQLAFEQLKTRLQAEGLFDQARKRELPRFPRKIGLVTSTSGAAIRDILRVIGRRFGELHIVIAPCRVQGDGAAEEIAQGIRDLNTLGDVDVIIAGRGGGSLEDLWAFNEEIVARAIVASKVPVVSAVGHEVDFTIADFVADLRAPTPSAAAELVVREKQAVVDGLGQLRARLERFAARPLRDLERRVDELTARLRRAMRAELGRANHRVALSTRALRASDPVARVSRDRHRLENLQSRMVASLSRRRDRARYALQTAVGRLDSLSPLAVLGRGYSLTRTAAGQVVHSPAQVNVGDPIRVLLHRGSLDARVTDTREKDDRPQV